MVPFRGMYESYTIKEHGHVSRHDQSEKIFGVNDVPLLSFCGPGWKATLSMTYLNTGLVDVILYWNLTQVRFFLLVELAPAYVKARRKLSTNKPSLSTLEI